MTGAKPKKSEKLDVLLERTAKHLLKRILEPLENDVMTVAEEAQAFKAVTSYYAMKRKLNPDDGKGGFNGSIDAIANLAGGTGARSGTIASDDDPDF